MMISHYLAKFSGHMWRYDGSGDIMVLGFQVKNYGWEPLMASQHPPKFGSSGHCGSGDIIVLICHVILQDQVTKGLDKFMGRNP